MFNFSFDRRTISIIIGVLVIIAVLQFIANPGMLESLLISIPGVLIAITFHEFAHAFVADKLGDDTARREGRLSLNQKDHIDPIGGLLLLVAGFGWGKPVHVDPRNYTRKMSMEKGEALVSIAGPIMNFIIAFLFAIIFCAIYKFASYSFLISTVGTAVLSIVAGVVSVNIGLGVFNLIPLPPLDGSKIFLPILPYNAKSWFIEHEQMFYFLFLIIWITGIAGRLISPIIGEMTSWILNLAMTIFGLR